MRWGDYSVLSGWTQNNHMTEKSRKPFPLMALKVKEGGHEPRDTGSFQKLEDTRNVDMCLLTP